MTFVTMFFCHLPSFFTSLLSDLSTIKIKVDYIKKEIMKPKHVHQEVLIFTNTTLSQKVLCNKNSSDKNSSTTGELEAALWNGLLKELAPEIMPSTLHPEMFIWGIHSGKFYLLIDLADTPGVTESILSIDPHLLLPEINMN